MRADILRLARDERCDGFTIERGTYEFMPVAIVALQRDEQIAGRKRARVDGKTGRGEIVRCVPQCRCLSLLGCP